MLLRRWNDEAVKRVVARAKVEESDPEMVLVEELARYLEGDKESMFFDLVNGDSLSLQGLISSNAWRAYQEENPTRLRELLEHSDAVGLGLFDVLATEVHSGRLKLTEALLLAFQFGKHVVMLADKVEQQQNEHDQDVKTVERRAVERELIARHYRRL